MVKCCRPNNEKDVNTVTNSQYSLSLARSISFFYIFVRYILRYTIKQDEHFKTLYAIPAKSL